MAVPYIVIKQQGPPGSKWEGEKVDYARLVSNRTVSTYELQEKISKMSTMSPADVAGVLTAVRDLIPLELADGNIVKLDGIGTFRVVASSGVLEDITRISRADFSNARLNYLPDKLLRQTLKNLRYKRK